MTARIDNYIAPVSWNDLGMDWSDPDPEDCKYVHAIVQALKQRLYGPSLYGYPVSLPVISPDIRMTYQKLTQIHAWTFALWKGNLDNSIRYLNCDEPTTSRVITKTAIANGLWDCYTGGNFDIRYTEYNYWTDESIIAAIGDDAIVYPQPDVHDNKAWLIQQYKLINKCNTHKIVLYPFYNTQYRQREKYIYKGTLMYDRTSDWASAASTGYCPMKSAVFIDGLYEDYRSVLYKFTWGLPVPYIFDIDVIGGLFRYYCGGFSGFTYEWPFASSAFAGIGMAGVYFEPLDLHIPANTQSTLEQEIGDLDLLSLPPSTTRYQETNDDPPRYGWGAYRQINPYYGDMSVIGKFNFDFQASEEAS